MYVYTHPQSMPAPNTQRPLSPKNTTHKQITNQSAGRGSTAFHTVLYFKENPTTEDAYVLRILESKLVVLVPRFGIEVRRMCITCGLTDERMTKTETTQTNKLGGHRSARAGGQGPPPAGPRGPPHDGAGSVVHGCCLAYRT